MKTKLKKFRVYAPPDVKSYGLNEDGTLTITGIASTTNEDLDGEIVSPSALSSLAKQVIGLNLHLDHDHSYKGGIGAITDAQLEDSSLRITAVILPEYAEGIKERLDLGMNFGFSIGGIPVIDSLNSRVINDFILLEVSLTLLPANWDTFGTVEVTKGLVESRCLTGACHYILKEKSDNMSRKDANNPIEVTDEIKQELVNIVNEAVFNLKPQLLDELRGELGTVVQDVVTEVLPQLLPPEVKEAAIEDEEVIEEEAAEDEEAIEEFDAETTVEEETDEVEEVTAEPPIEAEEEKAEDVEEEVETKATEEESEEEPAEEPAEDDVVEEEKEVTDEPIDGESTDEDAEYVETTETADSPKVIVDIKAVAAEIVKDIKADLVKEVKSDLYKELSGKKTTKSATKTNSKLNQFKKSSKTKKTKTKFLDSPERDHLGRNRKYI